MFVKIAWDLGLSIHKELQASGKLIFVYTRSIWTIHENAKYDEQS